MTQREALLGGARAVAFAPGGHVYSRKTNRDGQGVPGPGDDKILRVVRRRRPDAGTTSVR